MKFYNITVLLYFDQINAALKLSIRDLKKKTLSIPNFRMLPLITDVWIFCLFYNNFECRVEQIYLISLILMNSSLDLTR